ncbi:hypothetical protein HDA40_001970 [Hamadaea flava]|uniref:Uncharacterized protein n=1 Tax=Hamadaea flava TaxID=1742688 RepID=A0ABV8LZU7_9ACTN|nr:hypothetical protein [Hamadaea flava]MCP2323463.1 hypothetical protein [Hamadaea flava]
MAERATVLGQQMGITARTVMANYKTPELVREWGHQSGGADAGC